MGRAKFAMPLTQEALARAESTAGTTLRLLKQLRWPEALESQTASLAAAEAALTAAENEKSANADAPARPAGLVDRIQRAVAAARAAAAEAAKLNNSGEANPARCAKVQAAEEDIVERLTASRADLARASLSAPVQLTAEAASVSRLELVQGLLSKSLCNPLRDAADRFDVHWLTFGEQLSELDGRGKTDQVLAGVTPTEPATKAELFDKAVARYGGQPIAGIVTFTDGAFNDEKIDARSVADKLGEKSIPLYTVGIGLSAPSDVDLRSLMVQSAFSPKDKINARVRVTGNGYDGITTELRLLLGGRELARQRIVLTTSPQFIDIPFEVPELKSGPAELQIVAPEQPGELSVANNRVHRLVKILGEKINVLYIEGRPRWEYRYLRTVLLRDHRLNVRFLLTEGDKELPAASPSEYLAKFPETAREAFKYDLIVLGDVPSSFFNQQQLTQLKDLVQQRGGALLMLAGSRFAPGSYRGTPLAELLPIRIGEDYVPVNPEEYPALTAAGKRSFAMLAPSDAANDEIWSLVRPLDRLPGIDGLKPGAVALAELPAGKDRREPYPLIGWQRVGTGKTMYVGVDELWRLRYKTGDLYHAAFWNRTIQFMALSRLLGENKRILLESDVDEDHPCRPGQRVRVQGHVLDENFQPVTAKEYRVTVERTDAKLAGAAQSGGNSPAARELLLSAVAGSPGSFQASFVPAGEGDYLIQAPPEDRPSATSVAFKVSAPSLEGLEPGAQHARLRQMAQRSGGQYFSIADWPALSGFLDDHPRTIVEPREVDLWDHWVLYLLFVIFAGSEWLLRRRSYLV